MHNKTTSDAGPAVQGTARARVREDIRRLILCGELKPGTRLTQQHLAKRFGVAQSVVRESLLELQFTGLVNSVDNLGIFVGNFDPGQLIQSYEVREMLEGLAARLACERASRADVKELYAAVDEIHRLGTEGGNPTERGAADRHFHARINQISGNATLIRLTDAYRMLGMIVRASRHDDAIRLEHLDIVKAIEDNRPADAERAARKHVEGARAEIQRLLSEGQFVPEWVVD